MTTITLWHVNAPRGMQATERLFGSGRYHFGAWYEGSDLNSPPVPLWAMKQHGWSTTPLPNSVVPEGPTP